MIWSTLSFRAEKISLASRIWRPRCAIFRLTIPYSSWPASGSPTVSASPAVTLSRLRLICSSGPSAMCESPAARISERRIAMLEKTTACCKRGVSSFFRKTVDTPTRMLPKRAPSSCSGMRTSYTVGGLYTMRNCRRKFAFSTR